MHADFDDADDGGSPGQPRPPAHDRGGDLDERALDLFAALLELPAGERIAALHERTGADARLRAAVAGLLRDHDDPPPVLARALAAGESDPVSTREGTRIGPYRLGAVIGRGGMGVVYRAQQDRPSRTVALKVMTPGLGDAESAHRFAREVEVLGLLEHPGICRIHGAGTVQLGIGETMYFAMEFVDGVPLVEFARTHALDIAARCALLAQVCDAVQHAHERGVVHRDLKPTNILVASANGAPIAKVLDFGIARAIQADVQAPSLDTRTGVLLGTLQYMSPEQLTSSARNIDARSDVYSLGVLLYELLAGRLPLQFDGLSLGEVCRLVTERQPPALDALDRRLRGDLTTIAAKALAKDREDRYASAADLGADLRRFLAHEPIRARRPTVVYQLRRFTRRNRALVASVAATMLALIAGLIGVALLAANNDALAERERNARTAAEAASRELRASLYRSQMRLGAEAMLASGGVSQVRQIVDQWLPGAGGDDLRGFEWRLLWASCHREQRVLASEPVPTGLCWLADGARMLTMHHRSAVLRDIASGAVLQRFDAQPAPIAPVAVSADGRVLVQAVTATELRAIDPQTGARLGTFAHAHEVHRCQLSRDGALLACCGPEVGIAIWSVRTGERLATVPGTAFSGAVAFSADGRWFASGRLGTDGILAVAFATDDWRAPRRELRAPYAVPLDLAFDPRAQRLAATSHEGRLLLWDLDSTRLERDIAHEDSLRGLAFAPDGTRLAVACRNYMVYVHDLAGGTIDALRGHTGIVQAVAWSPAGDQLATIGDDAVVRLWRPGANGFRRELRCAPSYEIEAAQLCWRPDSRAVAVLADGLPPTTWDLDAGTTANGFVCDVGERRFRWNADAKQVECAARANVADAMTAAPTIAATPFARLAFCAASADGRAIALTTPRSGLVALWRGDASAPIERQLPGTVRGVAWLADARLAAIDATDTVRLLDGATGAELRARPVPECTLALAAAPVGDALAIGCVDQAVRIWSPSTDVMTVLRGHTGHVHAVAFAPDGARLASGSRDRTVRIWDVATGAEVASLPGPAPVMAVAWSPDGERLAALHADGTLVVWDARSTAR